MNRITKTGSYIGLFGVLLMLIIVVFKISYPQTLFTILLILGMIFVALGLVIMAIGQVKDIGSAVKEKNYVIALILAATLVYAIYSIFGNGNIETNWFK